MSIGLNAAAVQRIGPKTPGRGGKAGPQGPDKPAHLGMPPVAGQNKHSWYDGGPQLPTPWYDSHINTRPPISSSQAKTLSQVKSPYAYYGTSSGGRSRSALAKALTAPAQSQIQRQLDQFNVKQQQQAQQSLAQDILSQRQNTMDRFRMEVMKDIFDTDTWTRMDQGVEDLSADYERERKNAAAQAISSMFSGIGGALLGLI